MKLGLGTVRFAATRDKHEFRVSTEEARQILQTARQAGVRLLDTAAQAGNSEQVLGECLPDNHDFLIIAKTPHFDSEVITPHHTDQLALTLQQSLENLRQERVYALMTGVDDGLFHSYGERLYTRMEKFKADGSIEKIGVSVSDEAEIDRLLADYRPDIVQLPVNVLDQRLLTSSALRRLKKAGVEIHARDIFLQGVLLDPTHLHPWFWPIRKLMTQYHDVLVAEGLTPMEGALSFVTGIPEIDYALVGVTTAPQLQEVVNALDAGVNASMLSRFACTDEKFINPLRWNLYE